MIGRAGAQGRVFLVFSNVGRCLGGSSGYGVLLFVALPTCKEKATEWKEDEESKADQHGSERMVAI